MQNLCTVLNVQGFWLVKNILNFFDGNTSTCCLGTQIAQSVARLSQ